MTLPSYTVMAESKWVAYYLREGTEAAEMPAMWERRFPDLPISRYRTALRYARQMLRVGSRAQQLAPESRLIEALGRAQPPAENVSVSVLFHWSDAEGRDCWNTIKVPTTWRATIRDILATANVSIGEIMARYPGASLAGWEIIPSILWPSGEQL